MVKARNRTINPIKTMVDKYVESVIVAVCKYMYVYKRLRVNPIFTQLCIVPKSRRRLDIRRSSKTKGGGQFERVSLGCKPSITYFY